MALDGEQRDSWDPAGGDEDSPGACDVPRVWKPPCSGLTGLFYGERVWDAQQAASVCRGLELIEEEVPVSIMLKGQMTTVTTYVSAVVKRKEGPCPALETCLSGAVERGEVCGVWGGMLMTGRGPRDPESMAEGRLLHKRRRGE